VRCFCANANDSFECNLWIYQRLCASDAYVHVYKIEFNNELTFIPVNPLPPSDAVRKQKYLFWDLFRSIWSQFKKYQPSVNLKFNNLGIFQGLKLRNLMGKILRISLKLNFTPNNSGCKGLT